MPSNTSNHRSAHNLDFVRYLSECQDMYFKFICDATVLFGIIVVCVK